MNTMFQNADMMTKPSLRICGKEGTEITHYDIGNLLSEMVTENSPNLGRQQAALSVKGC